MSKSPTGAPRRVAVGLLAGALSVFGIALASPAGATADATVDRVAGATRYGTAGAVATEAYPDGNGCVIIASGENFPDALAASGLAGADGCPVLLVQKDTVPEETSATIDELGATDATIIGGTGAVSQSVEDFLADEDGLNVDRIAGQNRYETAGQVADAVGDNSTVIVASGEVAADALAAGPIAADQKAPILLTQTNNVPDATIAGLDGTTNVIIVGGTARISNQAQSDIEDASADADGADRLAGQNRQETSVAIAEYEVDTLGWAPTSALLAAPSAPNSDFSPDALVAGPLGGLRQAPILIVTDADNLGPAGDFLDDHSDTITEVDLIGGTAVLSDDLAADAETAVQNTGNDGTTTPTTNATATTRPELVSASIVETRTAAAATATRPAGTYVQYCFDEGVQFTDATQFFLYNADGTRFTAPAGTQTPSAGQSYTSGIDPTNNKCANVFFPAIATAAAASNLTLATVNNGAVTGGGGATDTNIEGDAPVTPTGGSTAAAAAGVTAAPDLLSVGNFRAGSTADVTAVDFTFDQAAFVQNVAGFSLVGTNGVTYTCSGPASGSTTASGQAAPGGEGTTVITVNCAEPVSSVQHDATTIARGVVNAGAVATTAGGVSPNPLEAADVSNGGNSTAPDLALVVFSPDALTGFDVVAYVFDQDITSTVTNGFKIYATDGVETSALGASRSTDPGGTATVIALYADGTLGAKTYVGGNVRPGSVTGSAQGAGTNAADEVGVSPSSTTANTAGRTDGPDLTAVTINAVTSGFGTTTYSVTYTFDEDTADTATLAGPTTDAAAGNSSAGEDVILNLLHLYTADGLDFVCSQVAGAAPSVGVTNSSALANRDEDHDNTVTCDQFTLGAGGTAATQTQIRAGVVGTADFGAVDDETAGGDTNPEGAALTTGGNGTPAS